VAYTMVTSCDDGVGVLIAKPLATTPETYSWWVTMDLDENYLRNQNNTSKIYIFNYYY